MHRIVFICQESKVPRCRFTNIQKQLPAPFVAYADFESILKPDNGDVDVTQGVETGIESSSHVFQEHISFSFEDKIVRNVDSDFSRPLVMYRGEDAAQMFVHKLQQAKQSHYRGATHNECYLMYSISKSDWKLPVVIHNLKGHDGHLIVNPILPEGGGGGGVGVESTTSLVIIFHSMPFLMDMFHIGQFFQYFFGSF